MAIRTGHRAWKVTAELGPSHRAGFALREMGERDVQLAIQTAARRWLDEVGGEGLAEIQAAQRTRLQAQARKAAEVKRKAAEQEAAAVAKLRALEGEAGNHHD